MILSSVLGIKLNFLFLGSAGKCFSPLLPRANQITTKIFYEAMNLFLKIKNNQQKVDISWSKVL
jgi:hypothetical protein